MIFDADVEFDWDDGNRAKCQNHGVSLAEIEAIFQPGTRFGPDVAHSLVEDRYLAIGIKGVTRPIFVVFTVRDVNKRQAIRPISARYMHQEEVDRHA